MKIFRIFYKMTMPFCLWMVFWGVFGLPGQEISAQDTDAVWGNFTNSLKPSSATNFSSTVFISGGHIEISPDIDGTPKEPQQGNGVKLAVSRFGQIVANTIPYPDFQQDAVNRSEKMLYYKYAEGTGDFAKEKAAFRYKVLVYGLENGNVTAQFQNMATYWTSAEYSRALEAAAIIRAALKYDPFHTGLRNALLDIYYDLTLRIQLENA